MEADMRSMRKDNPAVHECPKSKNGNGTHYWVKEITPPKGAICLNCGLQLNKADAEDAGFNFRNDNP
jgi:hypothetical protein